MTIKYRNLALSSLAGILLFCSFPPLEYSILAWVALVPVICLGFSGRPRESFLHGLLAGVVFWLGSICWLTRVSFIGWLFISLYCALYVACFALVVSWWVARRRFQSAGKSRGAFADLPVLFGVPAIWVGLEYARSIFLTGFPWNLLGVSQYSCVNLIQCADLGGVYLVSYLVVMGNTVVALVIMNRRSGMLKPATGIALFLLLVFLALEYGRWQLARPSEKLDMIRVAAVQLNVPQQLKWSDEWADDIYRRLKTSTAQAARLAPLDLIVWPETALPDFVRSSAPIRDLVNESRRHGIPLLVGSMDSEEFHKTTNYFNSAFLFLPGQETQQVYAKRHLVLFGEYVPLGNYLPFLRTITGVEEDFTPGTENVIFRLSDRGQNFSVLICFEDILPYLARECVRAGARLLINQTNDAWFDPSWASRQHMSHAVFRCVENRVACLRVTNTGLTCHIDRAGVVRDSLPPAGRSGTIQGEPQILRSEVKFSPERMRLSFYTLHGDLFAMACAAFSIPFLFGLLPGLRRGAPGISTAK